MHRLTTTMRYLFGPFELDADQCELREGARVVHVEPRVLDVLFFLVRNRDRVVTREELLEAVWKTTFIGDSAVSRCIMQARKAVTSVDDASGAGDEPIRTIHRRGYRFVAPVTESTEASPVLREQATRSGQQRVHRDSVSGAFRATDPEAERLCARAVQLWKKRTPPAMRTAIALLQEAIEIDPEAATAYAALADCYLYVGFLQQARPASVFPKAQAAIARALELDPTLAAAHACRGFIELVYEWDMAAADAALTEALRLDDGLAIAHHRRGLQLLLQRRFAEAEAALEKAAAIDPLSPIFGTACALPATAEGRGREAVAMLRAVAESEPSFAPLRLYLGLALESWGRLDDAVAELRIAIELTAGDTEALPALAHALARAGRVAEADEISARLRALSEQRFISPFYFAVIAVGMGDLESALERLHEAVEIRAVRMYDLHLDRRFAPLHGDRRFEALLARIGMDPDRTELADRAPLRAARS